ncbi:alpha/beta hydrolase [Maribacter sp. X9]|uniref:alpha/beta hydrolase n=1 Tax=Maribacter sp. X9 TaxID=3402159 RepID=UPI003AF39179
MMKKITILALFLLATSIFSQEVRLLKGAITENLVVNDSLGETYSIYLPTSFELSRPWPVVFVFDMKGKGRASMSMLTNAAEHEGYILASTDNLNDSLSIAQNVLVANRLCNAVVNTVPIAKNRTYTAGFGSGARFASILPTFIKEIDGVISIGASVGNVEILNPEQMFHFIGIVNRSDYNFRDMLEVRKVLDRLKFPNELLVYDGEQMLPDTDVISSALRMLTLNNIAKGQIKRNDSLIVDSYNQLMAKANSFLSNDRPMLAHYWLSDIDRVFNPLIDLDSLKTTQKILRRSSVFKQANRSQNNYFLKESFTKEDYSYYLEEDILTYNYANLGWWKYQMEELTKLDKSAVLYESQMASRLRGYINALIADNIDFIVAAKVVDFEALNFLYMLKTITSPAEYTSYLKVISNSSKIEDYGTALFYLEELLKHGYADKKELYALEHTALLRITPEFNELVEKYLKDARYDIIQQ